MSSVPALLLLLLWAIETLARAVAATTTGTGNRQAK